MKFLSSKPRLAVLAAVVLVVLFLLRPGASRLKSRIVPALSAALGRQVEVGSIHIRLLPRPGFDLENLVVYDDPAFGAEPMLRAGEVTASLRLTSLLRGRLEIARLDLTEPSLNLVHSDSGRWNLEALLERSAHIPLAPTGKAKSEPRAGFPYIEASLARINFKSGQEKKPYALTNADFSLWQDSENSWGVRLKAQPFRSDLNLNDTGLLQVSGTWQRAEYLRDTPLQVSVEWTHAQLGQSTKLFTGNDQGWRGEVVLDMTMAGTPAKLHVSSSSTIDDFRRYDITTGKALRLAAKCGGDYSTLDHMFHGVQCDAPVGTGLLTLKGDAGFPGSGTYGLTLEAEKIPANALVVLAQRAKANLPDDLSADGFLEGTLAIEQNAASHSKFRLAGRGEIVDLELASPLNTAEVGSHRIPFVVSSGNTAAGPVSRAHVAHELPAAMTFANSVHVEIGPFPIEMGHAAVPVARGWINRSGYYVAVSGNAEVSRVLRTARMMGIPALRSSVEGLAQLDLQIAGPWAGRSDKNASGFLTPQVLGTARLHNVHVGFRGTGSPLDIGSAEMQLSGDMVRVTKTNAKLAGAVWTGSLEMPRGCGAIDACPVQFNLNANQIALGELTEWVNPRSKEPWYRVLSQASKSGLSFLANVRAAGHVTADNLKIRGFMATHVSAIVNLDGGKVRVSELNADFIGGKHHGEWTADFSVKPALCNGKGELSDVSLSRVADVMNDHWIAGTANASYELKGTCPAGFWTSAEGSLQFEMGEGLLPHVSLAEDGEPLRIDRFAGEALLHAGQFEMKDAKLDSPVGNFLLNGTASLKRELDFKLARDGTMPVGYAITGMLDAPRVVQSSGAETQAKLKR